MSTATETATPTATWNIDGTHSQVGFEVKHLGVSTFRGQFNEFAGQVETDEAGALKAVNGTIKIDSIDVRDGQLAGHLKSSDFFDAETYPEGTLRSTEVTKTGEDTYTVTAELTLRDQTNPVEIEVTTEGPGQGPGGPTLGLSGVAVINRKDYGIAWEAKLDNGALVVAEKVRLVFHIEAIQA